MINEIVRRVAQHFICNRRPTMPYVMLLDGNHILTAGLASLITENQELQLEHVTEVDNLSILAAINRRQPDVIVITEGDPNELTRILELLETARPDKAWRIMIVRQDSNRIDIYDKRQVMIKHRQDVLDLLNHSSSTVG
jgi:nicotinate-nucleotide pyrophosphorylase